MPIRSVARLSLLVRVVLALAAVGVIPLLILAVSLVDANRTAIQTQVRRTHVVAATTSAERIETFLASRQLLTRAIAANPELNLDPKSEISRQFLADLLTSDPSLDLIEVITPAGESVIRVQRRGLASNFALTLTESLAETQAGRPVLGGSGQSAQVLLSETLAEERGYVRTISNASPVVDALKALAVQDEAEMALADGHGKLLLGTAAISDFPPSMITAARSTRVVGSGSFVADSGSRVLGAYAPVPAAGWLVLSRQPAAIADNLLHALRARAILAVGAALALVALLSWFAYRGIVRPIREQLGAQRQLLGGKFKRGADTGEIEELQGNFALLRQRVTDQEDLGRVFLGRYQVIDILGQGGMGTVFRGWDPKLERFVALKTIHYGEISPDETSDPRPALLREAVMIARLSHPNIVSVFDVQDAPEAAFFAMELIEGTTLDHLILARGALSPEEVVLVGLAVARALEGAHSRGILHHDIKPSNVLLGTDHSIKVTDFGISDVLSTAGGKSDEIFGTPGYIAPEGVTGNRQDHQSDLFSLGVLLHQCINGEQPFAGESVRLTMVATLKASPPALRLSEEWTELQTIINQLLEKKAKDRPASAAVVAAIFTRMVQQRGLTWALNMPSSSLQYGSNAPTASWIHTANYRETA